jgi:hypothetical protein
MVVLLQVNDQSVAIFEKDHHFLVSIGGHPLETPFASYHDAYVWVKRVLPPPSSSRLCEEEFDV